MEIKFVNRKGQTFFQGKIVATLQNTLMSLNNEKNRFLHWAKFNLIWISTYILLIVPFWKDLMLPCSRQCCSDDQMFCYPLTSQKIPCESFGAMGMWIVLISTRYANFHKLTYYCKRSWQKVTRAYFEWGCVQPNLAQSILRKS